MVAVIGSDETVLNDAVHDVVTDLLEGLDPSMALEDLGSTVSGNGDGPSQIGRALDALNTPPFLVPRRVVVVRSAHSLNAEDAQRLCEWSSSPTPGISLVVELLGARGRSPLAKAASRVVDVSVGSRPKDRQAFLEERLLSHGLKLAPSVVSQIAERLGDDVARVDSLVRTLTAVFSGSSPSFDQVAPYLGDAGDVPEWELTDAIDQGRSAEAIHVARRMLRSRARGGLQVLNILQRHYVKMARLEGSGAGSGEDAAAIVGGHAFPAQKLLRSSRLMGPDRVAQAIHLVARADADLKGGATYGGRDDEDVDLTDLTVIEVLVARLARLSESARRT
jgi:DNA polymerase-3 subunit delta